jgi:hypothetical protein
MSTRIDCPLTDCFRNRVREGKLEGICQCIHIRLETVEVDCEDDSEPPTLLFYCLEYKKKESPVIGKPSGDGKE